MITSTIISKHFQAWSGIIVPINFANVWKKDVACENRWWQGYTDCCITKSYYDI